MDQVIPKHGTDDQGRPVYSQEQYLNLMQRRQKLNDATFDDLTRAPMEGRVVEPDEDPDSDPSSGASDTETETKSGRVYTPAEWQAATERTHKMSESEFKSWKTAPEEGRVQAN